MKFLAILCAAVLAAGAAGAATMQAVWTGTIFGSTDQTGTFSNTGTLDGLAFSLAFDYDPTVGTRITGPGRDGVSGGSDLGGPSPMISGAFTVNGVTRTLGGTRQAQFSQYVTQFSFTPGTINSSYDYTVAPDFSSSESSVFIRAEGAGLALPFSLDLPFGPLDLTAASALFGTFAFYDFDAAAGAYSTFVTGQFAPTSLTVTGGAPAPVPLPATGLMLVAAGGAMALARRRIGA